MEKDKILGMLYIGAGLLGQTLRVEIKNAMMTQIAYDKYKSDSLRRAGDFVSKEQSMLEAWEFARDFMKIGFPEGNETAKDEKL